MKLIDLFRLSWTNLKGNRLRTILTVMGVGIGIGAIVFLVTLGFGLQKLTIDKITQSAALTTLDVNIGSSSLLKLNDESLEKIKTIENVESVSPLISLPGQITYLNTTTDCVVKGVDAQFIEWEGLQITPEKLLLSFAKADDKTPRAIVSTGILKLFQIGNEEDVINQEFTYNIFIPEESDTSKEMRKETSKFILSGVIKDDTPLIYMDVEELKKLNITNYNLVKVKVNSAENIESVKENISELGFNVTSIVDLVAQIEKIFQIIQGILAGFGIIALLVASIGMFNTMTIALLERTRDIGIMKAIGARKKDIKRMFIFESSIIGLIGGLVGIIAGWFLGVAINSIINSLALRSGGEAVNLFYTPWQFIVGVIIFSFFVGFLTGIYPARRAARINSLEALRYE